MLRTQSKYSSEKYRLHRETHPYEEKRHKSQGETL